MAWQAAAAAAADSVMKWVAMRAAVRQKKAEQMQKSQEIAKQSQLGALDKMMDVNKIRLV